MTKPLVIVSCGKAKIWQNVPNAGPLQAQDAYTGSPFKVNRDYARHFADRWVILSAKYGFINPTERIDAYEVSFKKLSSMPITTARLREQVRAMGLDRFECAVGLGGKEYRVKIIEAFDGFQTVLCFPFQGLRLGAGMQATKNAVAESRFPC